MGKKPGQHKQEKKMNTHNAPLGRTYLLAAGLSLGLASLTLQAEPGPIADSPLFLGTNVQPNVFMMLDDSGSMDWGLMTPESDGIVWLGGLPYWYAQPAPDNANFFVVASEEAVNALLAPATDTLGVWRTWYAGYNHVYYNPAINYTPAKGEDNAGNAFGDSTPTAARYNPYDAAVGTLDLTATTSYSTDYPGLGGFTVSNFYPARYYTWTDSDGDGVVDPEDAHSLVEIKPANAPFAGGVNRSDCANPLSCTYNEEIQNFANWFTYYRKRELTAKRALSEVINESIDRVGLGSINSQYTWTDIANMNDVTTPVDAQAVADKETLLANLHAGDSLGDTPLRSRLQDVGKYYDGNYPGHSSPILDAADGGICQQNFTILMSDGYWNGADPTAIGNADGNNDTDYDGGSYADSVSNTLADVAMHYYEDDLDGMSNEVPTNDDLDDRNPGQHMVTYTVAFGLNGTLTDNPDSFTDAFAWPDPTAGDPQKIDDMRHAAWNGRGKFLSAQDPSELIDAMQTSINDIATRGRGAAAAVAFNSNTLGTDSAVYLALFNSIDWSGDLLAYDLDPRDGSISANHTWSAADELDDRSNSNVINSRLILTHDGSTGVSFEWDNLSASQILDMCYGTACDGDSSPTPATDDEAVARLNFIRGDRSNEGGSGSFDFRERGSRLGDIVHSTPVYVGKPNLSWPDGNPDDASDPWPSGDDAYSIYKSYSKDGETVTRPDGTSDTYYGMRDRDPVIYTGANDGMLHGFSADDGDEVIAYIPAALFNSTASDEGLHYLSSPNYNHKYYVDLEPTVSDIYIDYDGNGSKEWQTILVGGQRAGGRGLFALNVTDPDNFSSALADIQSTVIGEFTHPDLGYTFSKPQIVLLNNERWGIVFGNGYNDTGSGEAKLFIVFLDPDLSDGTWDEGTDYILLTTGVGSIANSDCNDASSDCNGLSTPAVIDLDRDYIADRVYAGDLKGNVWVFDISNSSPAQWDSAYKSGQTPRPLFTTANDQPITVEPAIVKNKSVSDASNNQPNVLVLFGTGQYFADGDNTSTATQSFYGVWDDSSVGLTQGDLLEQTVTNSGNIRINTDHDIDYSSHHGWFFDLPDSGERVVSGAVVRGDLVYFNTSVPSDSPCSGGGYGWLMGVAIENGGYPDDAIYDINGDGIVDTDDLVTWGGEDVAPTGEKFDHGLPTAPSFLGDHQYTPGSQTSGGADIDVREVQNLGGHGTGRLSWEELM